MYSSKSRPSVDRRLTVGIDSKMEVTNRFPIGVSFLAVFVLSPVFLVRLAPMLAESARPSLCPCCPALQPVAVVALAVVVLAAVVLAVVVPVAVLVVALVAVPVVAADFVGSAVAVLAAASSAWLSRGYSVSRGLWVGYAATVFTPQWLCRTDLARNRSCPDCGSCQQLSHGLFRDQ